MHSITKLPGSIRQGLVFGLNSGIITTAGMIAGIAQTTPNSIYIIVAIISLAISDGFSEAYGLYISKKAEKVNDDSVNPFYASIALLLTKIGIVISFLIPFLFSKDMTYFKNLYWPFLWGIFILIILDYQLSLLREENILIYLIPHIILLLIVMLLSKTFSKLLVKFK
jgi:vacuolar iron transporter family protein